MAGESTCPSEIVWAADITAFIPDEHTLLIVLQMVLSGRPANFAAGNIIVRFTDTRWFACSNSSSLSCTG